MLHTGIEAKKKPDKELKPIINEHHSQPILHKQVYFLVFFSLKEQTSKGEGGKVKQFYSQHLEAFSQIII